MRAKSLYPGIVYFELATRILQNPIGTEVQICDADGRDCLLLNGIEMPIDTALNNSSWFTPVDTQEHQRRCHENAVNYLMGKGRTRQEAENLLMEL